MNAIIAQFEYMTVSIHIRVKFLLTQSKHKMYELLQYSAQIIEGCMQLSFEMLFYMQLFLFYYSRLLHLKGLMPKTGLI